MHSPVTLVLIRAWPGTEPAPYGVQWVPGLSAVSGAARRPVRTVEQTPHFSHRFVAEKSQSFGSVGAQLPGSVRVGGEQARRRIAQVYAARPKDARRRCRRPLVAGPCDACGLRLQCQGSPATRSTGGGTAAGYRATTAVARQSLVLAPPPEAAQPDALLMIGANNAHPCMPQGPVLGAPDSARRLRSTFRHRPGRQGRATVER